MRLVHFTNEEFTLRDKPYLQTDYYWQSKPNGFWVSDDDEYGWRQWCKSEKFRLDYFKISYEVILNEDANILYLKTADDVMNFYNKYPYSREDYNQTTDSNFVNSIEIDWNKVKNKHQGIVITPYQCDCRLDWMCSWYYGWDCASGCIWDISCIKELKLLETHEQELLRT